MPETWRLGGGEERARAAIVGCGGAGCNTLRRVTLPLGAERIALNDVPHPSMVGLPARILAKAEPIKAVASLQEKVVPTLATNEEKDLASALKDRDFVVILGGLGGDFGGWATGVVGRVARILGDTSLALVTTPFAAEGMLRRQAAEAQLAILRERVDGLVAFGNDELLRAFPQVPLTRAFGAMGSVMAKLAASLASVLAKSDLGPVKRILGRTKEWRFGMGAGTEKHRCFLAVDEAYHSPWFPGRHEDVRQVIAVIEQPPQASFEDEVLHEIHLRSPLADIAWSALSGSKETDRVAVQILAGLDLRHPARI
ncbi:MAG TPA: hypothetical protein VIB49_09395 [Thermoplasmata archaeon]